MSSFLQGLALGLGMVSPIMVFMGFWRPEWVLPNKHPGRLQVLGTYAFALPVFSFFLGLTSLWGGLGPSLLGWLSGLVGPLVVAKLLRLKRQQKETQAQQQAARTQAAQRQHQQQAWMQEEGTLELVSEQLAPEADPRLHQLAALKKQLQAYPQKLLASQLYRQQPDRFFSRYQHLQKLLEKRFEPDEITARRINQLSAQVLDYALERLAAMPPLLTSLQGLDSAYIQRRLKQVKNAKEAQALQDRQYLLEDLEARMQRLMAENETALTALDTTLVALAQINTQSHSRQSAATEALQELKRFSQRLDRYSA